MKAKVNKLVFTVNLREEGKEYVWGSPDFVPNLHTQIQLKIGPFLYQQGLIVKPNGEKYSVDIKDSTVTLIQVKSADAEPAYIKHMKDKQLKNLALA